MLFVTLILVGCKQTKNDSKLEQKPNVLIILADDLGYGDISTYGQTQYQTPNIDKIGEEGIIVTSFYVPTPYCAPSRGSLLTGRFPLRHGLTKNPTPDAHIEVDTIGLSPKEITIAEIFKNSGYRTKAIGKWHLGHYAKFLPIEQGFDEYYGILYSNDMRPVQIIQDRDTVQYPVDQRNLTKDYTAKAIDFIEKEKDNSFFLYLSHAMPHKPLAAPDDFYTPDTPEDLYDDVLRELDWGVGEVINRLRELDILDNTIVIFMSDNGPWYGGSTGGLKGMKATTWEGGIRVPFMIRYPNVFADGKVVDVPLSSLDILPTLCSLTNVNLPKEVVLDGEDITKQLQKKKLEHAAVFSLHDDDIMSIRKGDYKLYLKKPPGFTVKDYSNWNDPRDPDGTTIIEQHEQATPNEYPGVILKQPDNDIQLFNLKSDIAETNNLAESNTEIVEKLMVAYRNFKKTLNE